MAASAFSTATAPALGFLGDERLARLASRGDRRAFSALYERHLPGLTRYCSTILRHAADSEDAAQNAMVNALRALEAGTVPMRVKPWLYKIAHNEALGVVRKRRGAEVELDEATLPAVGGAEEVSEVRARLAQLMTDLRALTDRQRQALVLRELYDFSYADIGHTLSCTEAAAQQTVFEARSALTQFGEGRALACEGVQRALSECDGMSLRTRRFRAHLRDCECCKDFEHALRTRRRDLGLLFPPSAGAAGIAALLARIVGDRVAERIGEPLLAGAGAKAVAIGVAVVAGGGVIIAADSAKQSRLDPSMRGQVRIAQVVGASGATAGAPGAGNDQGAKAGGDPALDAKTPAPAGTAGDGKAGGAENAATGGETDAGPENAATGDEAGAATSGGGTAGSGGAANSGTTGGGGADGGSTTGGSRHGRGGGAGGHSGGGPGRRGSGSSSVANTVNTTLSPVQQTTGKAVDTVTQTATGAVDQAAAALPDATATLQGATQAVQQTTQQATGAAQQTTASAGGVVGAATGEHVP